MSMKPKNAPSEFSMQPKLHVTRMSRRTFNKRAVTTTFGAALGFQFIPSSAWGQLEKPTFAAIGVGGKGRADVTGSLAAGFQLVAMVDVVDARRLASSDDHRLRGTVAAQQRFPKLPVFSDYREMISELGDKVDAVTISTPDHHHFHAAALAMQAGMHVYCQKPLTHGIWEARMLTQLAAETGVKTQMGNQAHAQNHMRRCIELIRAGVIGKVSEVHAWTNRPIWPQGFSAPPPKEAVPLGLDWQQWVGPAPWTEYSAKIAPFAWRGWWDYGTGALGDMACHIMDMPYWALSPAAPLAVTAKQQGATELSPPINSQIWWEFGASELTSKQGFTLTWYDGYRKATFDRQRWALVKESEDYNHPAPEILNGMDHRKFGSVVIGDEGRLFFHRGSNRWVLQTSNKIDGFQWPPPSLPRAREENNYFEWFDAIGGNVEQAQSNFSLAGPLTETILLGVIAQRSPNTRLQWDADRLQIVDRPDLARLVRRGYRSGWEIDVALNGAPS